MASIIKIADIASIKETLLNFYKALRNFLATKTEMDVVATALTDLNMRIDESIQTISVGEVITGDPGTSAEVTTTDTETGVAINFTIPKGDKGDTGATGEQGPQGIPGPKGDTGVTPTISVGTVTTVGPGNDASVSKRGTDTNVILDFYIPRGEQGDMKELYDEGSDSCEVERIWVYSDPNLGVTFADMIQVPVPSIEAMGMDADCIKQTNPLTLNIGESNFKSDHEWKDLHWLLRCSNTDNIVYTTKYATHDASFQSVDGSITNSPPVIIEISVSLQKDPVLRYVQVTVENMYGRAYYIQKQ